MVDIHIRDISDATKRRQLVYEILDKIGHKKLVFEVANPRSYDPYHTTYTQQPTKITLLGDYRGVPCQVDEYSDVAALNGADAEILIWCTAQINRYGHETEAGENKGWWVRIRIRDLINITQQASVDAVVAPKALTEGEADAQSA